MLLCAWLRPASALQRIQRAALRRKSALPAAAEQERGLSAVEHDVEETLRETRWSATSVLRFSRSPFAAWLDAALTTASGADRERLEARRDPPDGFSLLLARKGDAWERQGSKELFRGKDVVDLSGGVLRASGTEETLEALHTNADIIYQAPLSSQRFVGAPDFLVREGSQWSIYDAKLSRSATPAHVAQLCCYAELLEELDVEVSPFATLVLGGGAPLEHTRRIHLPTYAAHWRRLRGRFLSFADRFDECAEPWVVRNAPLPRGDAPKDAHGRWCRLGVDVDLESDAVASS